ncbi:MAG: TetR/AcrR family transcriptional regulator [Nitrospinae bacterium]|nr:TetR/AcrR family transcriptional regulator [Nitrospinota bacterium]
MSFAENAKPLLSRRERKKQETEERILRAALSLFQLKGFEETTLEEISEKADVSRATLTNYFGTKGALVLGLSRWGAAEVSDTLERRRQQLGTTQELLQEFFVLLARKAQIYPNAFEKITPRLARFPLSSSHGWQEWGSILVRLLREGQERGEIRKDSDPQELAEVVAAVGFQSILICLRQQPGSSLSELLRRRLELLWKGIQESSDNGSS